MITRLRESPRKAITESRNVDSRALRARLFDSYLSSSSSRGKEEKDLVGYSTLESRVRRQRRESDESQPGVRDHRLIMAAN